MPLRIKEKSKVIEKFRTHSTDTGSSEVQVGLLTEEIARLAKHLKKNPKDNHSRRGLLGMVARRRTLLQYMKKTDIRAHNKTVKKLGLGK